MRRLAATLRRGLLLAAVVSGPAYAAEGDTLRPFVFGNVSYDNNVFRLSNDVDTFAVLGTDQRSDVLTTLGAGFNLNWKVGRQALLVNATVADNRYATFGFLDNYSADIRGIFKWQAGNDLWGDAGYSYLRGLTSFSDFRLPIANIQVTENLFLLGYYRFAADWRVRAQVGRVETDNSLEARKLGNLNEDNYDIGIQHTTAAGNLFGLQYRRANGSYPNRPPVIGALFESNYEQNNYNFTFDWRATPLSRLRGYVGYIDRLSAEVPSRNFDGVGGKVTYEWAVTGKTQLELIAAREILPYQDIFTSFALTNSAAINVVWLATSKITARAGANRTVREYLGDPGLIIATLEPREDRTNTVTGSVSYAFSSNWQASLSVNNQVRASNRPFAGFSDTTVAANLQFTY